MIRAIVTAIVLIAATAAAGAVQREGLRAGAYSLTGRAPLGEFCLQRVPTGRLDTRFQLGDGTPTHPTACSAMLGEPNPNHLSLIATR
jgi:hypothetical protein